MKAVLKAGLVYFGVVFAAGFILGAIRVLVLVPRLGEMVAVLLETPLMLAVSWFASRWTTKRISVPGEVSPRLLMGMIAFALLMMAEAGVSVFAFGRTINDYLAEYLSAPGAIGLAAQIAFAIIPAMQRGKT